jgi:hypothetical protein
MNGVSSDVDETGVDEKCDDMCVGGERSCRCVKLDEWSTARCELPTAELCPLSGDVGDAGDVGALRV